LAQKLSTTLKAKLSILHAP